ncbi:MAG: hypothetical protein IJE92_01225 [Clostridia bacterium]|nr:hypothetical protein [Clostridia bacterium]
MFNDLIELLLIKRVPAQDDYELALADFERAKRALEAKASTLGKINNMLSECGYTEPVEESEPVDEVAE